MTKGQVQEDLVTLYLRLNGYFTSGFIVHSPEYGYNRTELDVLAVRFPNNAEPDREIVGAPEIDRWDDGIDFIIGEVKSKGQPFQFNPRLRNDPHAVSSILQWWGHITKDEVNSLVVPVQGILKPRPGADTAPTLQCSRHARVRAILFSPESKKRQPSQAWFIPGPPIFSYIWDCFRPPVPRPTCSTVYDFGLWGRELEPIVNYFKDKKHDAPGGFDDLLQYLGVK